jgi:hypothetical protein
MSIKNQNKQYYATGEGFGSNIRRNNGKSMSEREVKKLLDAHPTILEDTTYEEFLGKLQETIKTNRSSTEEPSMTQSEIDIELSKAIESKPPTFSWETVDSESLYEVDKPQSTKDRDFFQGADGSPEANQNLVELNTKTAKMQKGGDGPALPENPFPIIGGKVLYNSKNNRSNVIQFPRK